MAWYSIYKWFKWLKKEDYPNMVYWYKQYYLKTQEQRETEKRQAINALMWMKAIIGNGYYNNIYK